MRDIRNIMNLSLNTLTPFIGKQQSNNPNPPTNETCKNGCRTVCLINVDADK